MRVYAARHAQNAQADKLFKTRQWSERILSRTHENCVEFRRRNIVAIIRLRISTERIG